MSRVVEIPAMVNAHSHAFQRDLRGRGERTRGSGDFWGWREYMYALAERLDPVAMRDVAARAYREMAAAGYGAVGEFHYVHDDENAMAVALAEAALEAGLVAVLLPAAYHRAGAGRPAVGAQRRFSDPDVTTFLARVDSLRDWARDRDGVHVGVAAHSVRAVPAEWLEAIAEHSERHGLVRHIHAHEQPRELAECQDEHGCSPIELLHRTGFLGPLASVVHGIHVEASDIARLADSGTVVVACPTTEGNLGDGHLPALAYRDAGVALAVGSDSNVRIDPFEELRELETGARRDGRTRDALLAHHGDLWRAVAAAGERSLGLAPGTAGTVTVDLGHPDLAGVEEADLAAALVTCASAAVLKT